MAEATEPRTPLATPPTTAPAAPVSACVPPEMTPPTTWQTGCVIVGASPHGSIVGATAGDATAVLASAGVALPAPPAAAAAASTSSTRSRRLLLRIRHTPHAADS